MFIMKVRLHQGSALSPYFFILEIDIMFATDTVLCGKTRMEKVVKTEA
jgi:hypothetical protein